MQAPHTSPAYGEKAFNCPHCGAYARQVFGWMDYEPGNIHPNGSSPSTRVPGFAVAGCTHCNGFTVWKDIVMIFPSGGGAPLPHPSMPPEITADYEEARAIAGLSPRGAAALLRLVVQKLCKHLGQPGKNINADIAGLVADGLSTRVQQALDTVRVVGNDAVHPGQIDLRDNPVLTAALFQLVNMIVEKTIAEPGEVAAIFASLPADKLDGIMKRDS